MAERRISPEILDAIKARLPLSGIVGRRVTWDKRKSQTARGDFWACCPFHHEKTPSFHVDDRKGFYHCFGCGASGDHVRFLMEKDGMPFTEAVEMLAGEAGIALPEPSPGARAETERRHKLADVAALAERFYQRCLQSAAGEGARRYAQTRGLSADTIETFRIGFAPDARDALRRHLADEKIPDRMMVDAGLLAVPEDGRAPYDRFRDRLIIPIHDARGRVAGFGGRALSSERQPKYLNSPDGPLFDKSRLLFNGHRAAAVARERGRVLVVEGYLDVIALHEAGMGEAVATLGTALTAPQAELLWRLADEPVICFDGDSAGRRAAFRAVDRLLPLIAAGRSFRFAFLPEGADPDDLVRAGGRAAMEAVIAEARPLVDVIWAREVEAAPADTPERRAALEARLDAAVEAMTDERVRKAYRSELRDRFFNLMRPAAGRGPRSARTPSTRPAPTAAPIAGGAPPAGRLREVERLMLTLGFRQPRLFEEHGERLLSLTFASDEHRRIVTTAVDLADSGVDPDGADDLSAHFPADLRPAVQQIAQTVPAGEDDVDARPLASLAPHLAVLRLAPDPALTADIFEHLLKRLELADLETELDREIAALGAECTPADEMRLLSLSRELSRRLALHADRERELADAMAQLRRQRAA